MILHLDRLLKPDIYCSDLITLDYPALYRQGYRLVLLDVDNTLSRHGARQPDDYARQVVGRIRSAGLDCRLISNAGARRITAYAADLGLPAIARARKPFIWALLRACRQSGVLPGQTVMIGDQLLTDVVAGHRIGSLAVLVHPRFRQEAWNVRAKRFVERLFYRRYKLGKM